MHLGVEMARKGGVPPDRVLNALPLFRIIEYRGAADASSLSLRDAEALPQSH
jgi:DNA polymerase (family X)